MWLCKVAIFLAVTGLCCSVRRPENNRHDDFSTGNRRIFRQRAHQSAVEDAESLQSPTESLQSPTFSILAHMAQPLEMRSRRRAKPLVLPIQGEELNAYNDEFTPKSERIPFRAIRKSDPRRRSKPSFNIAPPGVERNFQKRKHPETRDEARRLPPVYVPKQPGSSPEEKAVVNTEPEFVLTEEGDQLKPFIPNYPLYAQESSLKKEHATSALLTPDPEGNVEFHQESVRPQVNTNYEIKQPTPYSVREHAQGEVPNETQHYALLPLQQQLNRRPDVNFHAQKQKAHPVEYNPHEAEPEVSTYRPERVIYQRPIKANKYQLDNPNSYNQFDLGATPYQQPERNVASEPTLQSRPKPLKPLSVPKKILRKQPAKVYNNNYPTAIKEPPLEKRAVYDQHGSHSGGGYLDQNGLEFVSDASKTLKDSGHGRITFQIHGQEGPHSYKFGYDTGRGPHRQFRYEEKDGYGEVKGRYGFYDENGKLQLVNYSAHPEHGYQADVVPPPKY